MLPHESPEIPKSVLRWLWNVKLLKSALGVQTEDEVRLWMINHPDIYAEFDIMNTIFCDTVRNLQKHVHNGLQQRVVRERERPEPKDPLIKSEKDDFMNE